MRKVLNRIYRTTMSLLIVLCILLLVLKVSGVSVICVKGESMEPNYSDGEIHLIAKAEEYKRGDVVAVQVNGMTILKRIIAVEGDTLEIYHHTIWVNNELIAPYIKGESWNNSGEFDTHQTIEQNCIYLLGDDRNISADSRCPEIGTVKMEQIIGKVETK